MRRDILLAALAVNLCFYLTLLGWALWHQETNSWAYLNTAALIVLNGAALVGAANTGASHG